MPPKAKKSPLLENPRFGTGLLLVVAAVSVASARTGWPAWQAVGLHVAASSVCTYLLFAWDKRRAAANARRVSETNLWLLVFFGGALGAWAAMTQWRHKTRHTTFRLLVPAAAVAHVTLVVWLVVRP